jgi:histidinol-phosphate phosphatase family protein
MKVNKALFLDRDGTLVHDRKYPNKISQIDFIKGNILGLKKFFKKKFIIIIISNQSGVARKFIAKYELEKINNYIKNILLQHNIKIKKIYSCIHLPSCNCKCRKPNILFGLDAVKKYKIDLKKSLMIGNTKVDKLFAKNLGVKYFNIGEKFKSINDVNNYIDK